MHRDEQRKEEIITIILHYQKLYELYEQDRKIMVQDLRMMSEMVNVYKERLRMDDVAKELIALKLRQLGAKPPTINPEFEH